MTTRLAQIMRLVALPVALPGLLALWVLSVPSVSAGNPCFHGFTIPPATSDVGNEIKLMPCAFAPTVTRIPVGSEVTFFNGPDFSHLITGANHEWGSPDVELQPGMTVSYTFDKPGIYPYACVLHPGMSGAIVVGDLAEAVVAGTTTGGSIGASSGGGSSAAQGPATGSTAGDPKPVDFALVALGVGAGVIAGAAAAWLGFRRRSMSDRPSPATAHAASEGG